MATLLVLSSAPAKMLDEKLFLDTKFVEGMRLYSELWNGPVSCILKQRGSMSPFSQTYEKDQLTFGVSLLPPNKVISVDDISHCDIVLCSGDNHEYLHLAEICKKYKKKIVFLIEYTPETRRQIILLDPVRSLIKKLYSIIWTMKQERRRRHSFRKADGIQANGYPAFSIYNPMNPNTMIYLDSRIHSVLLATESEMEVRRKRLLSGAPVRLMHSGRLEPMKGSQDIIPLARRLVSQGVHFTLDIFGTGSLENEIRQGIAEYGLHDHVRLKGIVDFETELVPFARKYADIYLSCHRQSDPSCSYIESMGCGLAVIGYANRMWSALCQESGAGWHAPLGDINALSDAVAESACNRQRLAECCDAARSFAEQHAFEHTFKRRVSHLQTLS